MRERGVKPRNLKGWGERRRVSQEKDGVELSRGTASKMSKKTGS